MEGVEENDLMFSIQFRNMNLALQIQSSFLSRKKTDTHVRRARLANRRSRYTKHTGAQLACSNAHPWCFHFYQHHPPPSFHT